MSAESFTTASAFLDLAASAAFPLRRGGALAPAVLAYETYGALNGARDNAILLFHALSGSQHAAGFNPAVPGAERYWGEECRLGWWDAFIGPGRALDTDHFHVICANFLGGCYGSTGPSSTDPATGKPYGSRFPLLSFSDIVDSQVRLLDDLKIERLLAVVGGSLGGMLAMNLAVRHPRRVNAVIPMAAGLGTTTLQRVHNYEQIQAIENDPHFAGGDYYHGPEPVAGLALARMIAHKTYISLETMSERAREQVPASDNNRPGTYAVSHPVESYMLHQGKKFARRFDANTYLRILNAWQHYDLAGEANLADPGRLFSACRDQRFLVFSIDSDVCYYPEEQMELVRALQRCGVPTQHVTIHSNKGHDAFLLEPDLFQPHLDYTLRARW